MQRGNFASALPDASGGEIIDVLAAFPGRRVAVERIVSGGHATPPGEWYDQAWDEWVMVLKGAARIVFENPDAEEMLAENDWLLIPAHRRHRVAHTDPGTVWIAVHGDSV
jgi:cupin 2 domain-containing protein